jgi:hypothetical protein
MSRSRRPAARSLPLLLATCCLFIGEGSQPAVPRISPQEPATAALPDLTGLLGTGFLLSDRNGDGHADYLEARILLGSAPGPAETAAAANLAARLGFETMSLDPGLAVVAGRRDPAWPRPMLLVGPAEALPAPLAEEAAGLRPGQGVVLTLPVDRSFRRGGAAVSGRDETGLLAAADYLAGRYPSVWRTDGPGWEEAIGRFTRLLDQNGVAVGSVRLEAIVVDAFRDGVSRAEVTITLPDGETLARAAAILEGGQAARDSSATPDTTAGRNTSRRGGRSDRLTPADLEVPDLHRIEVRLNAPGTTRTVDLLPSRPWPTRTPRTPPALPAPDFSLADFYGLGGLMRDTDQDWIPDQVVATLVTEGEVAPTGLVDLAARIGLETAGIRIPLVTLGAQENNPVSGGLPIVYGTGRWHRERLARQGIVTDLPEEPRTGFIRFVREGFADKNGVLIGGNDREGLEAVTEYAAARLPYLWEYGKGNWRLAEVENEVRRFFQAKSAAGQVSLALVKLDRWLARLEGRDLDQLEVRLDAEQVSRGVAEQVEALLHDRFPPAAAAVSVHPTGFGVGAPIFTDEVVLPWEVDELRRALRDEALPRLTADSKGRIEVRVSESPEVRARLKEEIQARLYSKGIPEGAFTIDVLCAYKQGYSWLYDRVLPRLKGRDVGRVKIVYHHLKDSPEVRWQTIASDTRWLQELYPIDAVFARELGIPDSLITFAPTRAAEPVYRVRATDRSGRLVLEESFDPKYVVRPFFDLFPEYESVRVTTGWMYVETGGVVLLNRRIVTDPERFWDHLQTDTYRRLLEYVLDLQEGRPSSENAPYFDELRVDLTLSEPDYAIGIDEEVISSLEALHEDIYFETLTLFNLIGARWEGGSMNYPGRVIPVIHRAGEGGPGAARITLTGKGRARPELVLDWTERGGEPVRQRYPLSDPGVPPPVLRGIEVTSGEPGLHRLLFEVTATDSTDRYDEFRQRGSESAIDRTFRSVELLEGMVARLAGLNRAGLFEDALGFDRIGALRFRITLEDSARFARYIDLPRTRRARSTVRATLPPAAPRPAGRPIVGWEQPLDPGEAESILGQLNTFPDVHVWWAARSFLGHDVWVADLYPRLEGRLVSQVRLNALRPTLYLTGRQHANEVSSTSHLLRLAELLASDPQWRPYLDRVNVVIHPVTNPDGAWLVDELHDENPRFMLHAGYLGALGADATSDARNPDGRYPEARVRPAVQAMWLPDIMLDLHGYPSHEWVQYFAGYSAWVRGRSSGQRSWWSPRGWFMPGFSFVEDDRHPEITRAQFAVLDSIAAAITAVPEVDAMNRRLYARYAKYGRQDVEDFREYFHGGILVNQSLRGRRITGSDVANPRITWFSSTTEAPDEVAVGDWLSLVCSAGLAHTGALVRYLSQGEFETGRTAEAWDGVVTRVTVRKRPVLPPGSGTSGAGSVRR